MAKNKKKRHSGFIVDVLALIIFLIVFVISTAGLTLYRLGSEEESFGPSVSQPGEETTGKEEPSPTTVFQLNEEGERLSRDMKPITVDENSPFYEAFAGQDRVNVLLIGLADGMTDTIMVASYDMENQKVSLISVPRDTYYYRKKTDNQAENKINCFYSVGKNRSKESSDNGQGAGATLLAETVSDILYGMPIHYYGIVGYDDVREIMRVIGGVEVNIPFYMKYDDTTPGKELHIDIPEGLQTIDYSNVVEFLRFRHTNSWLSAKGYKSYRAGDIQRTEVQREFIQKVLSECLKKGNLVEVVKCAMEGHVKSDLTYATAIKIAKNAMKGLKAEDIKVYAMPGTDQTIGGLSFWVNDETKIYTMLEDIYGISEPEEGSGSGAADGQSSENGQKAAQ